MSLHWGMVLNVAAKKHISQRKCQAAGFIIGLLAAAYGVYVFITRNFLTYMFLRNEFVFLDYEELKFKFFLDYFALMGLCIFMAHYLAKLVSISFRRRAMDFYMNFPGFGGFLLPTSFRKSYPKTLKLQLTANTNL